MPATAKAFVIPVKQGEFVVKDIAVSSPAAGEILIKIQATSLSPVDWKIHKWGEVVELGQGVTDFAVGDRVFGQAHFESLRGSFQQYIVAFASNTAKIPPSITFDEAATIPCVLTAAYIGLYNQTPRGLGLTPPVSAEGRVITGGTSSVGQMALQLARISGFSPIITTASLKNTDWLKSLGATDVLDRNLSQADLIKEVKKLTNEKSVPYVYDAISSNETQKVGLELLSDGGKLAVVMPALILSAGSDVGLRLSLVYVRRRLIRGHAYHVHDSGGSGAQVQHALCASPVSPSSGGNRARATMTES
ncbi:hypothetical protein HYPSUDRAFT_215583 [Hypholoma sublateritium FD-334 SS-4]|uniref:Enoyl reductase (ER) domain-containing protein n=1 Tax=Hypholoma sublateritium (strain FD-334 SS-4) TaxID=945553 RepID=A0A0D2PSY2_HYPSF|nr:hypothetical protein HYPSUDRAFT_215583 [Hypholoma sublateritium FD-334 SS-4]